MPQELMVEREVGQRRNPKKMGCLECGKVFDERAFYYNKKRNQFSSRCRECVKKATSIIKKNRINLVIDDNKKEFFIIFKCLKKTPYSTDYFIDKNGSVYGSPRRRAPHPREIKGVISENGYKKITLRIENRDKVFYLHRLVYETFKGLIDKKSVVHHIDGDRENNSIGNLFLFTSKSEHTKHHNKTRERSASGKFK
jgi:hypothetical protein